MSLPRTHSALAFLVLAWTPYLHAQQAVAPVEQARLVQNLPSSTNQRVDANGVALSDAGSSQDDSFGEQVILASRPEAHNFVLAGDASVYYTNNAALTPGHTIDDTFFVANASISWTPVIAPRLGAEVVAQGSIFRYDSASALDFQSVGLGTGLYWNPEHFAGISLFGHYDFIEMLDRHSNEILRDNEFTLGAQKEFPLGRMQGVVTGITLMAGLTEPESAQRDQAGIFLGYHAQLTRFLGFELLYRFAGYYYNETGRVDRNQVWSANLHYRVCEWAYVNAFLSYTDNQSDDPAFDYSAVTNGGGLSAGIQF